MPHCIVDCLYNVVTGCEAAVPRFPSRFVTRFPKYRVVKFPEKPATKFPGRAFVKYPKRKVTRFQRKVQEIEEVEEEKEVGDNDDDPGAFRAYSDVELARTPTGAKVFTALKGAVDGELDVSHAEKRFLGSDNETKFSGRAVIKYPEKSARFEKADGPGEIRACLEAELAKDPRSSVAKLPRRAVTTLLKRPAIKFPGNLATKFPRKHAEKYLEKDVTRKKKSTKKVANKSRGTIQKEKGMRLKKKVAKDTRRSRKGVGRNDPEGERKEVDEDSSQSLQD